MRITLREAPTAIAARQPFTSAAAIAADTKLPGRGYLPTDEYAKLVEARQRHGDALYVVYSYDTPIAWGGPGEELYVPEVRYSVTTSKHQSAVRRGAKV